MFGESGWEQYIFIIVIVLLLVWSMTRRKKKSGNTNIDAVGGVLSDVDANQKILAERMTNWQSKKKFQTRSWRMYSDRLTFLESSLISSINETFALAEDFNARIDTAKKNRAMATLQDMPLEKLRAPLNKSREGLTLWLRTNYQSAAQTNQRSGCSGF
jgi:preprotein translocase subunit SecF